MARSKTIDKITPKSEMFFVTWMRSVVNLMNVDGWARLSIFSLILSLVLVLAYLFAGNLSVRRIGFYGGIFFLLLFIFSNVFAYQQKKILENRNTAIIIAPSATIKKTPSFGASDITVIHEGTKVEIYDDTMKDWKGIRLTDGRDGWIQTKTIEKI